MKPFRGRSLPRTRRRDRAGPCAPRRGGPTATEGVVAHIDGYGNLQTLLPANGQCRAQARGATWKTGTQLPPALTLSRAVGDSRQMQPWVVEANRNGSVLS